MANGNGNGGLDAVQKILLTLLDKHGPWALGCTVLSVVLIVFYFQPQAAKEKLLLDTITESVRYEQSISNKNSEYMATIAEATAAMVSSNQHTGDTLDAMDSSMLEFRTDVKRDHATTEELVRQIQADTEVLRKGGS